MYEDVLHRIKELYGDALNHNWIHLPLMEEFSYAEAALAYLKGHGKIVYVRLRDGRTIIRPKETHRAS